MKKLYNVMQGKMNKRGDGDLVCCGEFDNLKDAQECFNEAMMDVNNWRNVSRGDYIETILEYHIYDDDGSEVLNLDDNIIRYETYKLKK